MTDPNEKTTPEEALEPESAKPLRPADFFAYADQERPPDPDPVSEAAALLGRLGGLKGGPARARALSPERRKEIARKAIRTRWAKARGEDPPEE